MRTPLKQKNILPGSPDIDVTLVIDNLASIPLPALAFFRPAYILRSAILVHSPRESGIVLPPLNSGLIHSRCAESLLALLLPASPIAQRLEGHVPVIFFGHEARNGTTSRRLASRQRIVIIRLYVEGRIVVRREVGVNGTRVVFVGTSAPRTNGNFNCAVLSRRERSNEIF